MGEKMSEMMGLLLTERSIKQLSIKIRRPAFFESVKKVIKRESESLDQLSR